MTNEEKFKTPEERIDAFDAFCCQYNTCRDCPLFTHISRRGARTGCAFNWLVLEEELLSCPFCGSTDIKVIQATVSGYVTTCNDCWAASRAEVTKDDAIAAWNRRAK